MNNKIKVLVLDSLLLALLIVTSKISIPIGTIPFTLQLLVVYIICFICDVKNSLLIFMSYIILGLIGVPVFATPTAGIVYLISPTFGFIIGFLAIALITKPIKNKMKFKKDVLSYYLSSIISLFVLYLVGIVYVLLLTKVFYIIELNMTFKEIIISFVIIFIPFDLLKIIIAGIISERINSTIK